MLIMIEKYTKKITNTGMPNLSFSLLNLAIWANSSISLHIQEKSEVKILLTVLLHSEIIMISVLNRGHRAVSSF